MHSFSSSDNATASDQADLVSYRGAAQESEMLNQLRWRASQLVLVISSLAMALQSLLFIFVTGTMSYGAAALLAGSLWFALGAVVQGLVRRVSPPVERLGYLGALALFLGFYTRTMVGIFASSRSPGEMGEIFPWFATVFIVAFIIYSGRIALLLCGGVVLYTSGLSGYLILRAALQGAEVMALEASLDLFAANVISLLMLYVLRRTTEAWARTQVRAEAFAQLANEDALTGLYNRRYLNGALKEELERARRYDHPLSAALCDIDEFKRVNDRFSHGVGDQVLQEVARIMEGSVRRVDTVARYGGEEFVLVFPETEAAQARIVCEKIRKEVERHTWTHLHPELSVTLSVGVASGNQRTPEQLLSAADHKLYEAKRAGRNRVRL